MRAHDGPHESDARFELFALARVQAPEHKALHEELTGVGPRARKDALVPSGAREAPYHAQMTEAIAALCPHGGHQEALV